MEQLQFTIAQHIIVIWHLVLPAALPINGKYLSQTFASIKTAIYRDSSATQRFPSQDSTAPNSATFTLSSRRAKAESYRKKLAVHPHWLAEINSGQFGARACKAWPREGGWGCDQTNAHPAVALKAAGGGRGVRWLFNFCRLQKVGCTLRVKCCAPPYSLCLLRKANSKLREREHSQRTRASNN
jgi:hypothetical protein